MPNYEAGVAKVAPAEDGNFQSGGSSSSTALAAPELETESPAEGRPGNNSPGVEVL